MGHEETILFLHNVIRRFMETYSAFFPEVITDELTVEERSAFEVYFANEVLQPLLPANESVERLRTQHLQQNDLLAGIYVIILTLFSYKKND